MSLWIVLAAMTAIAVGLLLPALLRRQEAQPARASYNLRVYRDQLAEIDRDAARGLIDPAQAAAARAEIGRRLIAAGEAVAADDRAGAFVAGTGRIAAVLVAVAVPASALGLYLAIGSPDLATRTPASQSAADGRSTESLVAELGARLKDRPSDSTGWALYARSLAGLGRFAEAEPAFRRAIALDPGNADLLARHGETQILAAGGAMSSESRRLLEAALAIDPKEPRARRYLDRAGQTPAPPTPGPTADDVVAAQSMTPEARAQMIRSMVDGLAARLQENPGDADGWMRLGRSYRVLEAPAQARDAFAKAAALRPDDAETLAAWMEAVADAAPKDEPMPAELGLLAERVLALDPRRPSALWYAGLAHQSAGDFAGARQRWESLLAQLDPASPQHAELRRRIDRLGPRP